MIDVQVRTINGKKQFQDLVGVSYLLGDIPILVSEFNELHSELTIIIDGNKNGYYKSEEKISLVFGEDAFVMRLEKIYGIRITELNTFGWSIPTSETVRTLMNAGFTDVEVDNNSNIYIANSQGVKMSATFFTEEERNFLLRTPMKNRAVGKKIPMADIYYK
ncbi:MAG: hypothetical protein ACRDD8_05370 [Bacteroidales bacterium]